MSHFKVLCECCGKVMEQCRCPSPDKIITYKVCDSCKEANKEKAYTCIDCKYCDACVREYGDEYYSVIGTHFCRRSWNEFFDIMEEKMDLKKLTKLTDEIEKSLATTLKDEKQCVMKIEDLKLLLEASKSAVCYKSAECKTCSSNFDE